MTNITRRAFVVASTFLLAGCGTKQESTPNTTGGQAAAPEDTQLQTRSDTPEDQSSATSAPAESAETGTSGSGQKILVAYFSRADENYGGEWLEVGHTKVMAGYIAEALGADTYEIVPTKAYPKGYDDCCDVALEEQKDDARPAIANALPDVSGYGTVFVGCPIWWGGRTHGRAHLPRRR